MKGHSVKISLDLLHVNNKGTYQPVRPGILISIFTIHILESTLTEIFGLWLIHAALELQYCGSRAATTCSSRAALKYFVCKLVFRL